MKSCNFIITINNPTIDEHQLMEQVRSMGFKHFRGQMERGAEGTLHLQATFGGKSTRIAVVKKQFPTAHIEPAKSPLQAWEYCGKSETRVSGPVEFGVPPANKKAGDTKKERNLLLISKGAEQAVADGDICITNYAKLKHNIDLYKSITDKHANLDVLDNEWVYGPPGTGKSRGAREENPDHYDKPINKWWDDYKG